MNANNSNQTKTINVFSIEFDEEINTVKVEAEVNEKSYNLYFQENEANDSQDQGETFVLARDVGFKDNEKLVNYCSDIDIYVNDLDGMDDLINEVNKKVAAIKFVEPNKIVLSDCFQGGFQGYLLCIFIEGVIDGEMSFDCEEFDDLFSFPEGKLSKDERAFIIAEHFFKNSGYSGNFEEFEFINESSI